jgi:hypothetical protein
VIIYGERKFRLVPFSSEQELETVVQRNSELIFGPDSIYLPKSLIRTSDGAGTIPDGVVVDIALQRWFIVEAELISHSVWNHIAPQVAKQIIAASQQASRRAHTELVVNRVKENSTFREKFENSNVPEIDIRQFLANIFDREPIVAIPIDDVNTDLRDWAQTLKPEVKLWVIRKLIDSENSDSVLYEIPDEYRPVIDTSAESDNLTQSYTFYDVSVADLLSSQLLNAGEQLRMSYKPRNGERKQYQAVVTSSGDLETLGKKFSAPSYAALACIQNAGSERQTVNGWTSWKNLSDQTLYDLRNEFLEMRKSAMG